MLGLVGDVFVLIVPCHWSPLEKKLALIFTGLIFVGVYIGHIGQ